MVIFLFACRMSDPTTLVDELRIMGIRSNPAELSTDSLYNPETTPPLAEIWIANPQDVEIDLLIWPCTNFGDGCLEQEVFAEAPQTWVTLLEDGARYNSTPFPISPIPIGFVSELPLEDQPFSGTALWVLACQKNTCPIINEVKNGIISLKALADPFTLMNTLPIEEATLSYRSLYFSSRAEESQIQHPQVAPMFGGTPNLPLDEFVDLTFSYELSQAPTEDSRVFAYTTQGGFAPNEDVNNQILKQESEVTLRWFAPAAETWDDPPVNDSLLESNVLEQSTLFIFVDDGFGGLGVWQEDAYLLSSNVSPE